MKTLVVYWHPEPKSFNYAMFTTACQTLREAGGEVKTSNLHAMAFEPSSGRHNFKSIHDPDFLKTQLEEIHATEINGFADDLELEIAKMEWCDLMIWQFPLWWFGLPAVFKGWVDRVFAMGRVYGSDKFYETGALKGKRAMLSITTGGPIESYHKGGFAGELLEFLKPIHRGMLEFIGFEVLHPQVVYGPAHISEEQRKLELARYADRLKAVANENPLDVGRF